MEKHAAYCAMMRLGLHIPDTVLVPYKHLGGQRARPTRRATTTTPSTCQRSPAKWDTRCS